MDLEKVRWKKSTCGGRVPLHEYILRYWNPDIFDYVKDKIKKDGYYDYYRGTKYKYVVIGEHKYWIIKFVLNRCEKDQVVSKKK